MGKITCMQINATFFLTRYLFAFFSNRIYNRTSNDAVCFADLSDFVRPTCTWALCCF